MKLNVSWLRDPITGRDYPVISDDRGERLPGVMSVDLSYSFQRATEISIVIKVDGKSVTVGEVAPGDAEAA